jgi:hypothetical protein
MVSAPVDRAVRPSAPSPQPNKTIAPQAVRRSLTSVPASLHRVRPTAPDRPPTSLASRHPWRAARPRRHPTTRLEPDERRAPARPSNPGWHPRDVITRQFITSTRGAALRAPQHLYAHSMTGFASDGIYLARGIVGGLAWQGPLPCALRDPVPSRSTWDTASPRRGPGERGRADARRPPRRPRCARTPGRSATLATLGGVRAVARGRWLACPQILRRVRDDVLAGRGPVRETATSTATSCSTAWPAAGDRAR